MGENIVTVDNLWKLFNMNDDTINIDNEQQIKKLEENEETVIAVKDASFKVKRGEIFVVMGLSGSGKSTLIRCLLRLHEPTTGTIRINNREVTDLDKDELIQFRREQAAMVFQHYGLLPHRTVLENVAFGLKLCGVSETEREEKARETLALVGLKDWEESYPASLSGGMQQRVGIARALVKEPPILLMDEPFSGLDPIIRRELQDELLDLQEKMQKTIFFVTHDLDEAIKMGDRMAVMKDGRLVQVGTHTEIINNPANDYVRRFVQDKKEQLEATNLKSRVEEEISNVS